MPAATNNIRRVNRAQPKSPLQSPVPLSIAPRGNRSLMPTVKRAPRIGAKDTRDYTKPPTGGFDISGMG